MEVVMANPTNMRVTRALLPLSVFALTFAAHYAWSSLSGTPAASTAGSCAEGCGTSCSTPALAGNSYIETQSYFLGYSFALSLAFASVAIRQ